MGGGDKGRKIRYTASEVSRRQYGNEETELAGSAGRDRRYAAGAECMVLFPSLKLGNNTI